MSERKYEFTGETKIFDSATLRRIRAARDFDTVKAGEVGGWIETEDNLSHNCDAWGEFKKGVTVEEDGSICVSETGEVVEGGTVLDRSNSNHFGCVGTSGYPHDNYYAYNSLGVCLGFVIRRSN